MSALGIFVCSWVSAKCGCPSRDVVAAGSASRWLGEITQTYALPARLGPSVASAACASYTSAKAWCFQFFTLIQSFDLLL